MYATCTSHQKYILIGALLRTNILKRRWYHLSLQWHSINVSKRRTDISIINFHRAHIETIVDICIVPMYTDVTMSNWRAISEWIIATKARKFWRSLILHFIIQIRKFDVNPVRSKQVTSSNPPTICPLSHSRKLFIYVPLDYPLLNNNEKRCASFSCLSQKKRNEKNREQINGNPKANNWIKETHSTVRFFFLGRSAKSKDKTILFRSLVHLHSHARHFQFNCFI